MILPASICPPKARLFHPFHAPFELTESGLFSPFKISAQTQIPSFIHRLVIRSLVDGQRGESPLENGMRDSVFSFSDPGDYLRSAYQALKRVEPGVSHRYIALALGQRSSAAFCLLAVGRMHPSPEVINRLAKVFSLDRVERDHLALLFALRRMNDPSLREYVLHAVSLHRSRSPSICGA